MLSKIQDNLNRLNNETLILKSHLNSLQHDRDKIIQNITTRVIHNLAYKEFLSANKCILNRIKFQKNVFIFLMLSICLILSILFLNGYRPVYSLISYLFIDKPTLSTNSIWCLGFSYLVYSFYNFIDLNREFTNFRKQDLILRKALFQKKQSIVELINAYNQRINSMILKSTTCKDEIDDQLQLMESLPIVALDCSLQEELDRDEVNLINDQLNTMFYVINGLNGLVQTDVQNYLTNNNGWAYQQIGDIHDLMNTLVIEHERALCKSGELKIIPSSMVLNAVNNYIGKNSFKPDAPFSS